MLCAGGKDGHIHPPLLVGITDQTGVCACARERGADWQRMLWLGRPLVAARPRDCAQTGNRAKATASCLPTPDCPRSDRACRAGRPVQRRARCLPARPPSRSRSEVRVAILLRDHAPRACVVCVDGVGGDAHDSSVCGRVPCSIGGSPLQLSANDLDRVESHAERVVKTTIPTAPFLHGHVEQRVRSRIRRAEEDRPARLAHRSHRRSVAGRGTATGSAFGLILVRENALLA
jgi:hypothetical protein